MSQQITEQPLTEQSRTGGFPWMSEGICPVCRTEFPVVDGVPILPPISESISARERCAEMARLLPAETPTRSSWSSEAAPRLCPTAS